MKKGIKWMLAVASVLGSISASAKDFSLLGANISLSGFATAGFAISDQSYDYQRFINNDGTFKRDSLVGLQMDVKLSEEFSITVQGKVAPSMSSDDGINPTLTWAFLSWRPTNDLLFRGGRIRIPLYLNSQNTDIGATFDFARLPAEVYSASPTTDIDGLSASKTWDLDYGELSLEAYVGTTDTHFRIGSYNYPPLISGPYYTPMQANLFGAALTFQHHDNLFRIGAHDIYSFRTDGSKFVNTFPFVALSPDIGYYQVDDQQLSGPGVSKVFQLHSTLYSVGADIDLGYGFRVMGEYMRREMTDIVIGPDSQGAYVAILKSLGSWTPYISMAHLQSTDRVLNLYNGLKNNSVPSFIPNAALINASQRAAAATVSAYHQTTWALGTSYQINPTSKLKAEWAVTNTEDASSLIDVPEGGNTGNKLINVFTFSYNVVF